MPDTPARDLTKEEKKQLDDFNKAASKKAKDALLAINKGMNFADAVIRYSEESGAQTNGGDIGFVTYKNQPELYTWAQGRKDGEVSKEIVATSAGLVIPKRLEEKTVSGDKLIGLSHIIICYKGTLHCDGLLYATKDEALKKIQEIKKEATVANFADLAKKYSTDPLAKQTGGDLGKFEKGDVPEFEKIVWDMPVKSISEPFETEYGYHIVFKKSEEQIKEFHLARVLVKTKQVSDFVPPASEWKPTGLSGKQLTRAEVVQDPQTGQVQVSLKFDQEGSKLFGEITSRNIGKQVAIFLDDSPISVASVNQPILTGNAVITGGGINNILYAKDLTKQLNLGAIPVPIEILSQKKVDATLGIDSLHKSFVAGMIGLVAVMFFMVIYYRLPGLLSVFSLAFYALLNLALFKLLGVTLTLSGIAGFILSIGMAVDANVLVFERLKEELASGKTLRVSTEEAFLRSWPSIRDGHITALLSCVFLMWFGSGFVQGFAIILALGTLINLFTAITVTRTIMRFVFGWFKDRANWLFLGHTTSSQNVK
jgi:protein-export membrane protein SecD